MSRFKILKANPRRSLAALATVLVAVGVTGASGASFTAQSANPANTFTAGTLTMSNSKDNVAILNASNMRPGDPATKGEVTITNTGSLSGVFTLAKGTVVDSDTPGMSGVLDLVVTDCGADLSCSAVIDNSVKYTGTIAAMGTAGNLVSSLGTFASSAARKYEFSVALNSGAGNSYQGDDSNVEFVWTAA